MTNDDDLRTALTKLLDEYAADGPSGIVRDLSDLLAAHPAPTPDEDKWSHFATEREDVEAACRAWYEQGKPTGTRTWDQMVAEPDARLVVGYIRDRMRAVLAVLPAPPVVDETVLRDLILKVDDEGGWSNIFPDEATALAAEIAARLRGENRG